MKLLLGVVEGWNYIYIEGKVMNIEFAIAFGGFILMDCLTIIEYMIIVEYIPRGLLIKHPLGFSLL